MAVVVEDGTGKIDANVFADLTFIDAYFADRNILAWTGSQIVKDAANISATDFIEVRWGAFLKGFIEFPETPQALSFPRIKLWDRNGVLLTGVPLKLKYAAAEYSLIALTQSLMPNPVVDSSGLRLTRKKDKTGPLEDELEYSSTFVITKPYPKADAYMEEFISSAPSSKVIR